MHQGSAGLFGGLRINGDGRASGAGDVASGVHEHHARGVFPIFQRVGHLNGPFPTHGHRGIDIATNGQCHGDIGFRVHRAGDAGIRKQRNAIGSIDTCVVIPLKLHTQFAKGRRIQIDVGDIGVTVITGSRVGKVICCWVECFVQQCRVTRLWFGGDNGKSLAFNFFADVARFVGNTDVSGVLAFFQGCYHSNFPCAGHVVGFGAVSNIFVTIKIEGNSSAFFRDALKRWSRSVGKTVVISHTRVALRGHLNGATLYRLAVNHHFSQYRRSYIASHIGDGQGRYIPAIRERFIRFGKIQHNTPSTIRVRHHFARQLKRGIHRLKIQLHPSSASLGLSTQNQGSSTLCADGGVGDVGVDNNLFPIQGLKTQLKMAHRDLGIQIELQRNGA